MTRSLAAIRYWDRSAQLAVYGPHPLCAPDSRP